MENHPYLTDYGRDLTQHLWQIYVREMDLTGESGISNITPFIKTSEDAAGWYLMVYEHRAMEALLEHSQMSPNGLADHSCFGFRFQDVKDVLETCLRSHCSMNNLISHP